VTDFFEMEKSGWEVHQHRRLSHVTKPIQSKPDPSHVQKTNPGHHPPLPVHREENVKKVYLDTAFNLGASCFRTNEPIHRENELMKKPLHLFSNNR
jgi:hypothetical protein